MKNKNLDNTNAFLLGTVIGGVCVSTFQLWLRKKIVDHLIDDINIRTDLLNWVVSEGVYMEVDKFWPMYNEHATFINIVSK